MSEIKKDISEMKHLVNRHEQLLPPSLLPAPSHTPSSSHAHTSRQASIRIRDVTRKFERVCEEGGGGQDSKQDLKHVDGDLGSEEEEGSESRGSVGGLVLDEEIIELQLESEEEEEEEEMQEMFWHYLAQ